MSDSVFQMQLSTETITTASLNITRDYSDEYGRHNTGNTVPLQPTTLSDDLRPLNAP